MQNTACQFSAKRSQHLNAIKRFLQSDQSLMLIIGETGCGKTSILDDITLQVRLTRPVLRLIGDTNLNPSQFTQALAKHWNIRTTGNHPRLEGQLDELITGLAGRKQSYVLIIDNAHLMALSVLAAISYLTLKQQEKQQVQLHILIAGHPILTEKFNCLQTKTAPEIILGTLSREAAFRKIRRLFNEADLQLPHAAANAIFTKIFQQSKGLPKTLENMVQKLVAQRTAANQPDTYFSLPTSPCSNSLSPPNVLYHKNQNNLQQNKKSLWKKITCLVSLAALLLLLTWIWQHNHPHSPHHPHSNNASTVKKSNYNLWYLPENLASLFHPKLPSRS